MAKCKDDHWPGASSEKDSADTRRHSNCWLTRKYAERGVIFALSSIFAQLSMCHLSRPLPLSFSVSPSFAGLAGVQECLSVAKPNRSSQIHNMPSALSQAQGEKLLIFQRTLHYHSGQKHTKHQQCNTRLSCSTFREHLQIPAAPHRLVNPIFTKARSLTAMKRLSRRRRKRKRRIASVVYLRINFEHKVLLLFEVGDGVENITHGKYSAAIRSPILHMRWAFLWVIQQHSACKTNREIIC